MQDSSQITSGRDLNSYQGNAALASGDNSGGDAVGYAAADLSPLQTYALNKYKTNLIDYEQQQKDKQELQAKFTDPTQNVFLDETYAGQVQPLIDRQKELSLQNLQMNPNSKEWYEFHDNYNKLLNANAQLKTVQTLKQQYQDAAGKSADPHEKERMLAYADQLGKYKLGEEIPSYNKYFAYNDAHIPTGDEVSGTRQRINGDKIQTVKYSINNPLGLDEKANQQSVTTPESAQTGQDIAHTLIKHGGVPELNKASQETYNAGMAYNVGLLRDKYKSELTQYQKDHPGNGLQQFLTDTGKQDELKKINDGMAYLKTPVQYIPTDADGGRKLSGYTYSDDGKTRLNVSDNTLRAIYGANKTKPGANEEIIKEELSKTPAEINKLNAEAAKAKYDSISGRIKANAYDKLTTAKVKNIQAQTKAIDPIPESVLPQIGGIAKLTPYTDFGGVGDLKSDRFVVRAKDLPEDLRQLGGFGKIPEKPKITGNPEKDAAATQAYNNDLSQTTKGAAELRFFNSKGEDETEKFIKVVKAGKGTLTQAMQEAPGRGYSIKMIDTNGNVIGTTQSIDKQTLKESNKATKKGQAPLGTDLPIDNSEE